MVGIYSASGEIVDPGNLQSHDIRAWDIAWSLAGQNRFGGHSPIRWDILSHVGLMFVLAREQESKEGVEFSRELKTALLLREVDSVYLGEQMSPVKERLAIESDARAQLEVEIRNTVFLRFGLNPEDVDFDKVNRYAKQALWIEAQLFFPRQAEMWASYRQYPISEKHINNKYLTVLKPRFFVEELRGLCQHVDDTGYLFAFPQTLTPYVADLEVQPDYVPPSDPLIDLDSMRV